MNRFVAGSIALPGLAGCNPGGGCQAVVPPLQRRCSLQASLELSGGPDGRSSVKSRPEPLTLGLQKPSSGRSQTPPRPPVRVGLTS
jgi:hypothetical protein